MIYIIKENRTYDQIFGDLPAGDNDPSLTMYGRSITPNQHKLAERFGILDNFYDSGEVSGDGHVWSTAAITSDYTEKTWQQSYRGKERVYDYEGVVENGFPLTEKIPDVNEPQSSYLWTNLARQHKTYFHFAEFIATHFCGERRTWAAAEPDGGHAGAGAAALRKTGDSAWNSGARELWRGHEQVSVGDSADCAERGDEAGAGGTFRSEVSRLRADVSGPDALRGVQHVFPEVGGGPQATATTRCRIL